jgi:hypothetical protein
MGEGSVVGERGAGSADGRVDSGFLGKPPRQKGPAEDIWASFCSLQQAFEHPQSDKGCPSGRGPADGHGGEAATPPALVVALPEPQSPNIKAPSEFPDRMQHSAN